MSKCSFLPKAAHWASINQSAKISISLLISDQSHEQQRHEALFSSVRTPPLHPSSCVTCLNLPLRSCCYDYAMGWIDAGQGLITLGCRLPCPYCLFNSEWITTPNHFSSKPTRLITDTPTHPIEKWEKVLVWLGGAK